nr:MAG TPA: Head Tail Connector Protein [Caudoviricetes sp.]
MLTIEKAREWLRLDNSDNDAIISGLIDSAVEYITLTTGLSEAEQENSTLAETVQKFLLTLWYDPEQADSDKLQRSIDNLLKALS